MKLVNTVKEAFAVHAVTVGTVLRNDFWKTNYGVAKQEEIIKEVIKKVPAPKGDPAQSLRALIFDSLFNEYKGVVTSVRIVDGNLKKGDKIYVYKIDRFARSLIDLLGILQKKSSRKSGVIKIGANRLKCPHPKIKILIKPINNLWSDSQNPRQVLHIFSKLIIIRIQ